MKNNTINKLNISRYLATGFLLIFFISPVIGQRWLERLDIDTKSKSNFFEVKKAAGEYFKHQEKEYFSRSFDIEDIPELKYNNITAFIKYKRWEEYWKNHVDSEGNAVSPLDEYSEFKSFLKNSSKGTVANWVNINRKEAPGGYWGMGRIREIAFHPTDPSVFWAGADQGGIWKTTDNGKTYTPVADDLPFLKVSSICVNYNDPDILYMSAGGTDGGWWDRTIGVYKTTNGGQSWAATALNAHLSEGESYRRLAMSPANPELLIVTGREGIYRSSDGGSDWTKVAGGDYYDLAFCPGDGDIVIAGNRNKIMSSADGGQTWDLAASSNYDGYMRNIAFSPVNNDYVVAQLDAWIEGERRTVVYASTDRGITWTEKAVLTEDHGGTIGFSSTDSLRLYRGWTKIFRSDDLGKTWTQITNWYRDNIHDVVHADHFRIKKNPLVDNRLYFCNDGGVYLYEEDSGEWKERTAGLIISQYYSISSSQSDPNVLLAGSQDNGGWYRTENGDWKTTNGGDAMHTWQHPDNNSIGLSSYPGGKLYRTYNAWDGYVPIHDNIDPEPSNGDWNSRYAIDPNNFNIIVTGCYPDIYRSENMGNSWEKIGDRLADGNNFHCITIPEANSDYIYASSGNELFTSTDRGASWSSSTPSGQVIKGIAVNPGDPEKLWIVSGGFSEGEKVFFSKNGGMSWNNISGSLPNLPALSIVYEKGTNDGIYIGMTYGVYYRNNSMNDWVYYGHGIPNCEIRHLDIQYPEGKIRCATYGRGIYETGLYPVEATAPEAFFTTSSEEVCQDDTIYFDNESRNADYTVWNFGDGTIKYAGDISYFYSKPGYYTVKLTATNEQLSDVYEKKDIKVNPYLSPVKAGPEDISIGSVGVNRSNAAGIVFNVASPVTVKSFVTYAATGGRRRIKLEDNQGNEIYGEYITLETGENKVELDIDIDTGNDYILRFTKNNNLLMNTDGADYPYNKNESFSITGNTELESDSYYFFYDISVQYRTCSASELPVIDESTNIAISEILVYPNPARDKFYIEVRGFDPDEKLSLRISNLNGDIVYRKALNYQRIIEISREDTGKTDGILIVEVSGQNHTVSSRVLKMK